MSSVRVSQSRIENAGLGLFATRDFKKNEKVSRFFMEDLIDRDEAIKRRALGLDTHIVTIEAQHLYADGLKAPLDGEDLASFANHSDFKIEQNTNLKIFWNRKLCRYEPFLVANRAIQAGEELCTSYGKDYWDVERPCTGLLKRKACESDGGLIITIDLKLLKRNHFYIEYD